MIPSIMAGSLMRATPPAARMSAGTRSRAITATAPASSAILAWSGVTTSMMTPPLSIWASPFLVAQVDVSTVMCCVAPGSALRSARPAGPGVLARSSRRSRLARPDYRMAQAESPPTCGRVPCCAVLSVEWPTGPEQSRMAGIDVSAVRPAALQGGCGSHSKWGFETMRKLAVVPIAGLLILAIAAPGAAAANVTNQTGSSRVINGEWSSAGGSGYAYFATDSANGAWGEFYEESGEYIDCDGTDERYGFVGRGPSGGGAASPAPIDARLNHGTASGTLDVLTETVNDCTGEYTGTGEPTTLAFETSLDGV